MNKQISPHNHRIFSHAAGHFDQVGDKAGVFLASVGADISLLLSPEEHVIDVAYRDPTLEHYGVDDWIGRPWRGTVSAECVYKIDALIEENAKTGTTQRRQVNHPATALPDLPVDYTVLSVHGVPWRLALGEDMRKLSEIQQRLLRTQAELEADHRKIREAESRYRTIFHKTTQPIMMVNGESFRIIDINLTGADLLHQPASRLIDKPVQQIVERAERATLSDALNAARYSGTRQSLTINAVGHPEPLDAVIEPYRDIGGSNLMVSLLPGTPMVIGADLENAQSAVLDGLPESLVIIDRKRLIGTANDAFLELVSRMRAGGTSDFAELVGRVPLKDLVREAADVIEKRCIEAALRQTDNNRASAADMLGLSRQSLYIKLRRYGLEDFPADKRLGAPDDSA